MLRYKKLQILFFALILTVVYMLPVLRSPAHNILDCPFDKYQMETKRTEMWKGVDPTRGRVKPAFYWFLLIRDNVVGTNPFGHYIFQSIIVVGILFCIGWIVCFFGKNIWFSVLAMLAFLSSPPAIETFFTLNKQDQLVLFWLLLFSVLSLFIFSRPKKNLQVIIIVSIGTFVSVVGTYFSKESGALSFPMNLGLMVTCLILVRKKKDYRRWWFVGNIALNIIGFAFFVKMYMALPYHYTLPGSKLDPSINGILSRLPNHLWYIWQTTAPVVIFLAIGICLSLIPLLRKNIHKSVFTGLLWAIVGAGTFWSLALPWTRFVERYFPISYGFIAVATGLVGCLMWQMAKINNKKLLKIVFGSLSAVYVLWVLAFVVYGGIVRWYGEGQPRVAHANATAKMFDYIANNVPENDSVQFVITPSIPETVNNTKHYLKYFENRKDIKYKFPNRCSELKQGYLVVPTFSAPINFARMAVHLSHSRQFWKDKKNISDKLHLLTNIVCSAPVKYVNKKYGVFQYATFLGIPLFGKITSGTYSYGWKIYEVSGLIANGDFNRGLKFWEYWKAGREKKDLIQVVKVSQKKYPDYAVRICNPQAKLIGIKQAIRLKQNAVYKLSGKVRSLATINSKVLFGARLAVWRKGYKEAQIKWMTENTNWWNRSIIFTNDVDCVGSLYLSMGYGKVASTGEFANISLKKIK